MERPTGPYFENREAYHAWWNELARIAKKRYHALPEDKGTPVPCTGKRKRRKWENGSGVSASSRVLSHYYADEGDKGRWVRKVVRNRERRMWRDEWLREQFESEEFDYDVNEWFESEPLVWDWYDDAEYWVDMGCGDPHCPYCEKEFRI